MYLHYAKIAFRYLQKHKGYTFINVTGLAVGLACCVLLVLFVREETGYDQHHTDNDRIYRVINERHGADGNMVHRAVTPPTYAWALKADFPEVEQAARLYSLGDPLVRYGEQQAFEDHVFLADSTIFDVLTIPLVKGNPKRALVTPYSLVITEAIAEKYFGDADPIGQTLNLSNGYDFEVTGVMEAQPAQSHITFSMLGSFATMHEWVSEERLQSWRWQQFYTYLLLGENAGPDVLAGQLAAFATRHADAQTKQNGFELEPFLQPLADIHLHSSHLQFDVAKRGERTYVYAFTAIALFILLIACFNFMNLATARSLQRAKEVGLRKVIGAARQQLIFQFLSEAVFLTVVAFGLALGLVHVALPSFNTVFNSQLAFSIFDDINLVLVLWGTAIGVGLLAGSYPALFLSGFQPLKVMRGLGAGQGTHVGLRKALVVAQFAISIMLISATVIVRSQLAFVHSADLGFDQESLVVLPIRNGEMRQSYETIKAELLRHPQITAATASYGLPGSIVAGDDVRMPGQEGTTSINVFIVDHRYTEALGMEMVAGRALSPDFSTDESQGFLLNEAAVPYLGFASPEDAVGQAIGWDVWGSDAVKEGVIVGVVRDFNYRSLHSDVEPAVLHIHRRSFSHISVRVHPEEISETMAFLASTWKRLAPDWPFEYYFMDEDLAEMYASEATFGRLFTTFSGLAIIIACLGLFALAAFTAERRTQEIGVRKVLGASVQRIVFMLSKEVVVLVGISFLIATPIAYFAMEQWLGNFAYRMGLGFGPFVLTGSLVLVIACVTISYQSVKAALTNPIDALRTE